MSIDIDAELRAFAERLDRAMPTISHDEVASAVPGLPVPEPRFGTRRLALVAAVLLLITGGTVAVAAMRNAGNQGTPAPSGTLISPDMDTDVSGSAPVTSNVAPTTDLPSATDVATTDVATIDVATTMPRVPTVSVATVAPLDPATVADIHLAQIDALRRLPGYAAIVTETRIDADGTKSVEETSIWTLADGSYYVESGAGLFDSYDPYTDTRRSAFIDEDGEISYEQVVGASASSTPLRAIDPTEVVMDLAGFDTEQVVEIVEHDGRSAWRITTTYDVSMGDGSITKQVGQETIDPTTGLLVERINHSNDPRIPSFESRLDDVEVIDVMPAEFPGSFPPGAAVAEPEGSLPRRVDVDEVAAMFGIPTPIPATADTALITVFESSDARQATFIVTDGFVRTATVTIKAQPLFPADGTPAPDFLLRDDGYVCPDLDADQQCDTYSFFAPDADAPDAGSLPRFFEISAGALSGQTAAFQGANTVVFLPPFHVDIDAESEQLEREIAETFQLVVPS